MSQHRSGLRRIATASLVILALAGTASAASAMTAFSATAESAGSFLAFTSPAMPTPGSAVLASAGSLLLLRRRKQAD